MRLTDGVPLDPHIRPLCEALACAGMRTVYSCGAHLDRQPPSPRAYVTFSTSDAPWVQRLRDYLVSPAMLPEAAVARLRRDLHFDCLHGRYTLSLWPPDGPDARGVLDATLHTLTAWVGAQAPAQPGGDELCTVPAGRRPDTIPCRLTLAAPPAQCAWTGAVIATS